MPSVTTSMRVARDTFEPKRTVSPTRSPSVCAIRSALARAAIRRGSSTIIFLPLAHGASSSASGTRVVLPAPGGATSTAALRFSSVRDSSSRTASIGRGVSKARKVSTGSSWPGLSRASTSFLRLRKQDVDGRDKPGHDGNYRGAGAQRASNSRLGRAAYAFVRKPVRVHVFGAIDVAQVDHDRMGHLGLQPLQVERAV